MPSSCNMCKSHSRRYYTTSPYRESASHCSNAIVHCGIFLDSSGENTERLYAQSMLSGFLLLFHLVYYMTEFFICLMYNALYFSFGQGTHGLNLSANYQLGGATVILASLPFVVDLGNYSVYCEI